MSEIYLGGLQWVFVPRHFSGRNLVLIPSIVSYLIRFNTLPDTASDRIPVLFVLGHWREELTY